MHTRTPHRSWSAAARDLAAGSAAAAVLTLAAACVPAMEPGPVIPPPASGAPSVVRTPLVQPRVVPSVNGVLNVTMRATMANLSVPIDSLRSGPQWLRAFQLVAVNGVPVNAAPAFPGPTFQVNAGDSIHIVYVNDLPPSAEKECMDYAAFRNGIDAPPNCFHGPSYTNIHYHGFHVSPGSPADNVLISIAPRDTFVYAFRLPRNQSPGTHWYHPHKHGSVALQVTNGMSGAFIVRGGGLDSLTMRMNIAEYLLAIQKIDSQLNLIDTGLAAPTLVNGQYLPTIRMRPNEVQRWRIVNENITKTANFVIGFQDRDGEEPTISEIARDGVQYSPINYRRAVKSGGVLMSPGNRLDLFVQAPADTGFHVMEARSVAHEEGRVSRKAAQLAAAPPPPLFYVEVVADGRPVQTQLPTDLPPLPPFLQNLPGPIRASELGVDTLPTIVFTDTGQAGNQQLPPAFFLGSAANPQQQFTGNVFIPTTSAGAWRPMLLGRQQTWVVKNFGQTTNHPFHIHINPFQVLYVHYPRGSADPNAALYRQLNESAQLNRAPIWLDVVALPLPATASNGTVDPGYVVIRQAYENFSGRYVMHCHILGHEERGMMQVLQIFPTLEAAQAHAAGAGHEHH
jgi:FtsP/CotA-like multicopper oxidase with cupredoxin domain